MNKIFSQFSNCVTQKVPGSKPNGPVLLIKDLNIDLPHLHKYFKKCLCLFQVAPNSTTYLGLTIVQKRAGGLDSR